LTSPPDDQPAQHEKKGTVMTILTAKAGTPDVPLPEPEET
jgi:hypothetical protein